MKEQWSFQATLNNVNLPELFVRIDKEPQQEHLTVDWYYDDNDTEENYTLFNTIHRMFFSDGLFDKSLAGVGILRSDKKTWKLNGLTLQNLDFGDFDILEKETYISITWKFQKAELVQNT